jgi:hypothetical protein
MKKEIADIWVKALISKKYKQGKEFLCQIGHNRSKSFCCLGVLCDLYQQDRAKKKKKKISVSLDQDLSSVDISVIAFDGVSELLPQSVMKWAGMKHSDGTHCDEYDYCYNLAEMNDIECLSFIKIANHIKKHYKEI